MIGKEISIPEENKKAIIDMFNTIKAHKTAMNHHAEELRSTQQIAWGAIKHLLPEMNTKKYVYSYNQKNCSVECTGFNPEY